MRRPLEMPTTRNVVAGGTLIQDFDIGPTYDLVTMNLTNITLAQLTNIHVKANNRTMQFFASGQVLQDINDYYGRPANSNVLQFPFARPEMHDPATRRLTALGTDNLQTVTIEADIDGAVLNPAVECRAIVDAPRDLGLVTKVKRFPFNATASGEFELSDIIRGPRILAMHLYKADVNRIEIELGDRRIVERDKTDIEYEQELDARVPQTSAMTTVDWCLEGDIAQALVTSQVQSDIRRTLPMRFIATLGTSGSLPVYVEYLDGFQGI